MKLVPGPKRILVEHVEGRDQVGGIFIPEQAKAAEIVEAKVLSLERFNNDDRAFEEGDHIIFMLSGGVPIEIRNKKYYMVHEDNILAVINFNTTEVVIEEE